MDSYVNSRSISRIKNSPMSALDNRGNLFFSRKKFYFLKRVFNASAPLRKNLFRQAARINLKHCRCAQFFRVPESRAKNCGFAQIKKAAAKGATNTLRRGVPLNGTIAARFFLQVGDGLLGVFPYLGPIFRVYQRSRGYPRASYGSHERGIRVRLHI